jgi:hypothetical protein
MLPEWTQNLATDVVVITTILAFLVALVRVGIRVMRFCLRLERSILAVERELKPNGGESLRDRVDQLGKQHHSLIGTLAAIERRLFHLEESP